MRFDAILSSHSNPYLSGVARFNRHLSQKLGVPLYPIQAYQRLTRGPVLISVKFRACEPEDFKIAAMAMSHMKARGIVYDLFLHSYDGYDIEIGLIKSSRRVFCANAEIAAELKGKASEVLSVWCPRLIEAEPVIEMRALNILSFGMVHKLQIHCHRRLAHFLKEAGIEYSLWVSTAFHEKARFGDFDSIGRELEGIYDRRVQFMGFLSDGAVNYFLSKAHLLAAFFEGGVRANNTSVYAAMEKGCPVLTNCDSFSPSWLMDRENILDIHKLDRAVFDPVLLKKIGMRGKEDVRRFAHWDDLLKMFVREDETHRLTDYPSTAYPR